MLYSFEERRKWQNPETILAGIGLKPGETFMDIGCGEGFFTLPAARLVGAKGKVYALDINGEAIERLRERALVERLGNISLVVNSAEETLLCRQCADVVFFGQVLHDFRDPGSVLRNARKMLKPGGRLVDLDWRKEIMEIGPPRQIRVSEDEAVRLIQQNGFVVRAIKAISPYHYLITARPDIRH
ncbi:MAG: methyltransferase domain-containing protein [Dehalococcoidales bacterium]|nr:methyltransferase domain-containing protein [Dehalococcoidales bacterium]